MLHTYREDGLSFLRGVAPYGLGCRLSSVYFNRFIDGSINLFGCQFVEILPIDEASVAGLPRHLVQNPPVLEFRNQLIRICVGLSSDFRNASYGDDRASIKVLKQLIGRSRST